MKVKLRITEPLKTSHQFYAIPLSIIMNNSKAWDWYYSEFIQLFTFRDDSEGIMLRLYNYESEVDYAPLEYIKAQPEKIKIGDDIVSLCKLMIKNGYYVYMFCDDYYINAMNINFHRVHDILIYGFDDGKNTFNIFAYNGIKLAEFETSYKDICQAYNASIMDTCGNITMFYRQRDNFDFRLNIEKIKWHLLDYIEGVDTLRRERPDLRSPYKSHWGSKIYSELINMYLKHFNDSKNIGYSETYCLFEHKKDLLGRIKYLSKQSPLRYSDEIYEQFNKLSNKAQILNNLVIKTNTTIHLGNNDHKMFNKMKNILDEMYDIEMKAMIAYYDYNREIFENI